MKAEHGR